VEGVVRGEGWLPGKRFEQRTFRVWGKTSVLKRAGGRCQSGMGGSDIEGKVPGGGKTYFFYTPVEKETAISVVEGNNFEKQMFCREERRILRRGRVS